MATAWIAWFEPRAVVLCAG